MKDNSVRVPLAPGSIASGDEAPSGLRPSGDDPSRGQTIDLEREFFSLLVTAASESSWIPQEYFVNDWVADCADFLRHGPSLPPYGVDVVDALDAYSREKSSAIGAFGITDRVSATFRWFEAWERVASAIEARRAAALDAVHESAIPVGETPNV